MKTDEKQLKIFSIKNRLEKLAESPLYSYRKKNGYYPVVGDGNMNADIMFVGEAPGKKEAETGKPFCGAAGKMLDTLLASIGILRQDVFITNIVQDRPPENRDPKPDEITLYSPFLLSLIGIINPKVLVTLGRFSMRYLLEKWNAPEQSLPIGDLHGKPIRVSTEFGEKTIVPLYHPAYALYNGGMRKVLEKDFTILSSFIAKK